MAIPQSRRFGILAVSGGSNEMVTEPSSIRNRHGWRFTADGASRATSTAARAHAGHSADPGAIASVSARGFGRLPR